jgi:hypothetical protein
MSKFRNQNLATRIANNTAVVKKTKTTKKIEAPDTLTLTFSKRHLC